MLGSTPNISDLHYLDPGSSPLTPFWTVCLHPLSVPVPACSVSPRRALQSDVSPGNSGLGSGVALHYGKSHLAAWWKTSAFPLHLHKADKRRCSYLFIEQKIFFYLFKMFYFLRHIKNSKCTHLRVCATEPPSSLKHFKHVFLEPVHTNVATLYQ